MLQWGRNMIVAEGVERGSEVADAAVASMGPQHDSCGRRRRRLRARADRRASMGPQHDSCGRRGAAHVDDLAHDASMGPQHDSCGRMAVRPCTPIAENCFNGAAT